MAEFLGRFSSPVPTFALMINAVNFYRIILIAALTTYFKATCNRLFYVSATGR